MRTLRPLLFVLVAACGGGGHPKPDAKPDNFNRSAMLAHLANEVLLPIQTNAAVKAAAVPAAIDAYCDALEAGTPGTTRDAARAAWAAAIDAWERAEAVLIGPAAMDNNALRYLIYSWPVLNTCETDRDTASRYVDPASYDISTKIARVRSLAAIEYLLYPTKADSHTCLVEPPGWSTLGANLPLARCRHAEVIAIDVAAKTAQLEIAWKPDGGNYVGTLADAGKSGSPFASAHEAVNVVSDGLFYVDYIVKDMKLAEPSGISDNACGLMGTPCELELELPYSDRTTFAVRQNLVALREVFTGKTPTADGPGFDDFLSALGHADVADQMVANLDNAIVEANKLTEAFRPAALSKDPQITATHAALKAFTDDLKSQFLTLLALELPDDVPADND